MPALPTWLATLQRVREHHRDAAWQSLAHSLRVTTNLRDAAAHVKEAISRLRDSQEQCSNSGRLDSERLRQIRQDRDDLQSQLAGLRQQQYEADSAVRQAQVIAASKDSDVQVLKRLDERLQASHQLEQRRREQQMTLDAALSLCNGPPAD